MQQAVAKISRYMLRTKSTLCERRVGIMVITLGSGSMIRATVSLC